MAAPTLVASLRSSAFTNNTSPKTAGAFTCLTGDLLVVKYIDEGASPAPTVTPSGGSGLTYTSQLSAGTAGSSTVVKMWTADIPSDQSVTVSVAKSGNTGWYGIEVEQWRAHGGVGVVNSATITSGSSGPTVTLTGVSANSAISMAVGDWLAGATTGKTYRTADAGTFTESAAAATSNFTYYLGRYADAGSAANKTIGLSAPNMRWTIGGVEIKGSAGGGGTDATVNAVVADGTGDIPAPTVTASSNAVTPAADATGDVPTPTVSASSNIVTPPADGTGDTPTPTISAGANAVTPAADGTGDVPAPTISAGANVTAAPCDATADIPAPSISAAGNATVNAVVADAIGDIPGPTVSASSTVIAVPCDATGDIPVPVVTAGGSATVTAPPVDATGDVPAPVVKAGATVTAVPCDATGDIPAPAFNSLTVVLAPPVDATGDTPAPIITAGATVTAPAIISLGILRAPTVSGGLPDTNPIRLVLIDGSTHVTVREVTHITVREATHLILQERA